MRISKAKFSIIVSTATEFKELQSALISRGYEAKIPGKEYSRMNLSQIFEKENSRIDVFETQVCNRFSLTDNMKRRSEKVIELNHSTLFLCSNEDIFLFKTLTEREGDISDCINLAKKQKLDWDVILGELKNQIVKSGQDVWITWVGERLDLLEDRGLIIPIMKDIDKLRKEFYDKLEKKMDTANT